MNIEQIKKLLEDGQKKLDRVELILKKTDNFEDLINLIKKNGLEITELNIEFFRPMDRTDSSKLLMQFNDVLKHITGLKTVKLTSRVTNEALNSLLLNKSLSQLEEFEFNHIHMYASLGVELTAGDPISSHDFIEKNLVDYLKENSNLNTLTIYDPSEDIGADNYPKLASALSVHPKLHVFNIHTSRLSPIESLANDFKQRTRALLDCEREFRIGFYSGDSQKNYWANVLYSLPSSKTFKDLLRSHEKQTNERENLDGKKALLKMILHYHLPLLNEAANLQHRVHQDKKLLQSPWVEELTHFWDYKRIDLSAKIKQVKNGNYSQVIKEIKSERRQLIELKAKIIPVIYPASYKQITRSVDDPLLQAKKLLEDYTKNNSFLNLVCHGHLNRHHVLPVHSLIQRINSKEKHSISTLEELFSELKQISLKNNNGSLSRRIRFIEENCLYLEKEENKLNCNK